MSNQNIILAIDIGNTRTKMAVIKNGEILNFQAIPSKPQIDINELTKVLDSLEITNLNAVLVSSVVPHNNEIIKKFLKDKFLCSTYIIERGIDLVIKEKYGSGKAGIDIMCKSAYLTNLKQDVLCIDSGTATVINYVSKEGYLEKIAISVGFRSMYRALYNDASLLPLYEPDVSKSLLNNNTQSAINGGNYFGYIGLLNALVKKAKEEVGTNNIYFTGGFSAIFKDVVDFEHIYDPYLLFKGIYLIYINNKEFFNKSL